MAVLLPALNRAREQGKRVVCMNNIKQLTVGWNMYADTFSDKIVNGATQGQGSPQCDQCPTCPAGAPYISKAKAAAPNSGSGHDNELPWVGGAYFGTKLPDSAVKCAIETGALFMYVKDFKVYRCPTGNKGELITYNVVDGMNGMPCPPSCSRTSGVSLPGWMKNRNQITKASSRFVFIDEGRPSVDSYAVYYGTSSGYAEKWFDPPPVRHENGTSVSFADGHSAFHKWKSQETITIGNGSVYSVAPSTCDAKNDLYWVQIGCWGQLGYTPSCPVNLE
jgi:prepilin-type processing-associated H-X9-DG protein